MFLHPNKFPRLPLTLFLALRYLKPKRTFLSVITIISITGVILGVTVLILVIAVMTGFEMELRHKIIGFEPHVTISSHGVLSNWRECMAAIKPRSDVTGVAPFVQGPVIVEFNHLRIAPNIRGIHHDLELTLTDMQKLLHDGKFDLSGDNAILGIALARALGVKIGDKITIFAYANLNTILSELGRMQAKEKIMHGNSDYDVFLQNLRQMILPKSLTVVGTFKTGRYLYDSEFLLIPLHLGQELYHLGDGVHGLAIKITDPYVSSKAKEAFLHMLSKETGVTVDTWIERNQSLFDAIHLERHVMFFLLMFIILVAAFSVMNTLIATTVQKTKEIGILKALGAQTWQIVGIFVAQGMVIGLFGTLIGLGLGIFLLHYRNAVSHWMVSLLGIDVFPKDIYQLSEIPAEVITSDIYTICVSAFLVSTIAALLPAWFAARLDPVKALRYS